MTKFLRFIIGIALIVICYYVGELLSILVRGFISPAVMGMLVLFVLLQSKIFKATWLDNASEFLLDNLVFFFIPATAGVALIPFYIIKQDALIVIAASVLSSIVVLLVVGFIIDKFEKRDENRNNT